MSTRQVACIVLVCDGCGKDFQADGDHEGLPHFADANAARLALIGDPDIENPFGNAWVDGQHLPDGRDLCGDCNGPRLCAERGHRFTEWLPRTRTTGYPWRYCKRCSHAESQEPASA